MVRRGFVLCAVVLALGAPRVAAACSGPADVPTDPQWRFEEYDLIVRGTIVRVQTPYEWVDGDWQLDPLAARYWEWRGSRGGSLTVAVSESWKGPASGRMTLVRDGPDSCCGMRPTEVGEELLIYAREWEGEFGVDGMCTPMTPIEDAGRDLAYLGEGEAVRADAGRSGRFGLVALGLLVVGAGGLILWRRAGA